MNGYTAWVDVLTLPVAKPFLLFFLYALQWLDDQVKYVKLVKYKGRQVNLIQQQVVSLKKVVVLNRGKEQ